MYNVTLNGHLIKLYTMFADHTIIRKLLHITTLNMNTPIFERVAPPQQLKG